MKYLMLLPVLLTACGDNDPGLAKNMELTKRQRAMIEERITPFGWVNVAGVDDLIEDIALAGETLYAACGACHGANGGGGVGPKLKGQTAEYIVGRLNQYRNGEKVGSQSNMMWGQAAGLSDKDIDDLAEYIVTL
tara:strand:+ start:1595 stop:1999 length:405 start_codon:yes stop_codon:yes gene_type:complete